ncbi:MAG: FHA domain-containing protein, partial [Chloroflexota bacterium]|nr:FHA domain-containing protein [Chloroflexota bacterium]
QTLKSYEDWSNLNFKEGNIGKGGTPAPLQITPEVAASAPAELTVEDDRRIRRISEPRGQPSVTVNPNASALGGSVTYSLTVSNIDSDDLNGVSITFTLPIGFRYQPGSSQGITSSDPVINNQDLIWAGPFTIPANAGKLTLTFKATASNTSGTFFANVSGSSTNGVVLSSGDTAPVAVGNPGIAPLIIPSPSTAVPPLPSLALPALLMVIIGIFAATVVLVLTQQTSSRAKALLVVTQGQASRNQLPLSHPVIGIGRDHSNHLVFPSDAQISRRHAEIRRESVGYVLYDLRSHNGTFVNDERVTQHALQNGDRIRIGASTIVFQSVR